MALNVVVLEGRLGRDPEIRQTNSGIKKASFSVAVDRPYKNGDEKVTDWISCVAWRQTAEFIEKFFHKGDLIGIVGSIQTRKWTDEEGQNRYATEVMTEKASFVAPKKSSGGSGEQSSGSSEHASGGGFVPLEDGDGELPF